jgi:hypothetical protein
MYLTLLNLHSVFRWLVLISLLYAIFRAYQGYRYQRPFTKAANSVRHWTATIAHVQLMIGIVLYSQSPLIKYFFAEANHSNESTEPFFFVIIHLAMMLTAIVLITIGSALAKRKTNDAMKFRTMLIWFSLALVLIFVAIPWPFSPLAQRPYLRPF